MMETEQDGVIRAAQYVRMSTEHQQYSTQNQRDKIQEYAEQHNIQIVRTYADDGKSGLSIGGRPGLRQMIADIEKGDVDFSLILIYDVSRWGRFQDADESAYWEYRIRQTGVRVKYTAEQFDNDGSPVSTIVKGVKRAMAGEYSRELSDKTFLGICNIVRRGFRPGGPPGFGYRRQLIDIEGRPKGILEVGEHKSIQTDRIVVVPGPSHEIELIRCVFRWYADEKLSYGNISKRFNAHPLAKANNLSLQPRSLGSVLFNERYIGTQVYNRTSIKLKGPVVHNPPELWVVKENAFEGIVPLDLFERAQQRRRNRQKRISDAELIERLTEVAKTKGPVIRDWSTLGKDFPPRQTVLSRFGGVTAVYVLFGLVVGQVTHEMVRKYKLSKRSAELMQEISSHFATEKIQVDIERKDGQLLLDGTTRVKVALLFQQEIDIALSHRYHGHFPGAFSRSDIVLWVILENETLAVRSYYVIPTLGSGLASTRFSLTEVNHFRTFQCPDLHSLSKRLREVRISEVANQLT